MSTASQFARICAGFAICALLSSPPAFAAARPVAPEDLFKIAFVNNPQIAPDGSRVVFVVSRANGPKEKYDSYLYLVDTAGGVARRITSTGRDSDPAWSPDSRTIAFTRGGAKKGERPQIYAYSVASGSIRQLTHVKNGAGAPLYSHDGRHILFRSVTLDAPHAAYVNFGAAGFKPARSQKNTDVRIITGMHFEANGQGYTYDRHAHIWIMNADGSGARALTSGHEWSEGNPRWSPDDKTIAFSSLRRESPSLGPSDIYTIAVSGGRMRRVPSHEPANDLLDFDRQGNLWLFRGGIADPAQFPALVESSADGSAARTIVPKNRIDFGDSVLADMGEPGGLCGPHFLPGGDFAILDENEPGYSALVELDTRTGAVRRLTNAGEASECTMDSQGRYVAYTLSDFTHPREVYLLDLLTGASRRLTGLNDGYVAGVQLSQPQHFTVTDDAGFTVHAWFMPALDATPGKRLPTLLDIHGGPETQFGQTFFLELQYWAGQGYNVVFSDPRGSVGFGYAFEEALAKHWGAAMFDDVQRVMDAAQKRPDVDPNRLGVLGGSYGGYATLWVIAHTHRYRTAVAERVVSNLATEQLAADLASDNALGGRYSWGLPWQPSNQFLAQSPISYVANVTTPLLILHSEEDTRTPIDQTLQEFSALKILGRTVEYVDFPGENHDLSRVGTPIHRIERLHILADWLRKYLKP